MNCYLPHPCSISLLLRIISTPTIPVAAQSKAWVWGRSPAEIAGLNPAESMDILSLVNGVFCEGTGADQSFKEALCMLLSVFRCNNNPLHLKCVSGKRPGFKNINTYVHPFTDIYYSRLQAGRQAGIWPRGQYLLECMLPSNIAVHGCSITYLTPVYVNIGLFIIPWNF
jgi:hypothetical protein